MRSFLPLLLLALAGCSERNAGPRACTPPLPGWRSPHPHLGPDVPMLHVAIDHDGATWASGKKVDMKQLAGQLSLARAAGPPDFAVVLETEMGAPCARLDAVRRLIDRSMACSQGGHCDEGVQRIWRDLPVRSEVAP